MQNENEGMREETREAMHEDTLKAHLKALHRSLEERGEVDDELEMLLRQLDG